MAENTWWEKIEAKGDELIRKINALVAEGNIRRVRIRQGDHVLAEFSLTLGAVGVLLAPVLAAIGAIAALATDCTIEVLKADNSKK